MRVEKGKEYMAGPYHAWKCRTLTKPHHSNKVHTVLVVWLTGGLKTREARILVADMKECGDND